MQWVYIIIAGIGILLLMVAGIPIFQAGLEENPAAAANSSAYQATGDLLAVLGTAPVLLVFGLLLLALVVVLLGFKGVKLW